MSKKTPQQTLPITTVLNQAYQSYVTAKLIYDYVTPAIQFARENWPKQTFCEFVY